ncbi:hypothetical protein M9Y10_037620 [Tritrichomonas musculus]|uniref:Uncharacterized protein n=1 Tax=Tritrichomonas musculus TaxID=1915356 RepID=A0ABR2GRW2_9EUKA
MSISPDFFFDLTPKCISPSLTYDIIESELLPMYKKIENSQINYEISQSHSVLSSNTKKQCLLNNKIDMGQNCTYSNRFKITKINNNSKLRNPALLPQNPHKFRIKRIPRNKGNSSSFINNGLMSEISVFVDNVKEEPNDDIIILF